MNAHSQLSQSSEASLKHPSSWPCNNMPSILDLDIWLPKRTIALQSLRMNSASSSGYLWIIPMSRSCDYDSYKYNCREDTVQVRFSTNCASSRNWNARLPKQVKPGLNSDHIMRCFLFVFLRLAWLWMLNSSLNNLNCTVPPPPEGVCLFPHLHFLLPLRNVASIKLILHYEYINIDIIIYMI